MAWFSTSVYVFALKFDCTEKKWYTSLQQATFSEASFMFITQMMWGD